MAISADNEIQVPLTRPFFFLTLHAARITKIYGNVSVKNNALNRSFWYGNFSGLYVNIWF